MAGRRRRSSDSVAQSTSPALTYDSSKYSKTDDTNSLTQSINSPQWNSSTFTDWHGKFGKSPDLNLPSLNKYTLKRNYTDLKTRESHFAEEQRICLKQNETVWKNCVKEAEYEFPGASKQLVHAKAKKKYVDKIKTLQQPGFVHKRRFSAVFTYVHRGKWIEKDGIEYWSCCHSKRKDSKGCERK